MYNIINDRSDNMSYRNKKSKKNKTRLITLIIAILSTAIILGVTIFAITTLFGDGTIEIPGESDIKNATIIQKARDEDDDLEYEENTEETTIDNYSSVKLETKKDGKVAIYLFRGEGCPHCEDFEIWIESIKKEHGDKFVIEDYEIWYNQENYELMKNVAKTRGENISGVPYIIIGNKSWNGFTESYKKEMLNEIIKQAK